LDPKKKKRNEEASKMSRSFLSLSFLSFFLCALCYFHLDSAMLMTLLAMASRFFITIAMNTGIQYTVELIPTQLRGQGTGVVHITGHGATFFAPFILYLVH
jgi:uncharacterized membrane protein